MRRVLMLAVLAALAAPAHAGERTELKPNDPIMLDAAHAYVLIQVDGAAPISLMRRADDMELAAWRAKRLIKQAKAIKRSASDQINYDRDYAAYLAMRPGLRIPSDMPIKPDPIDENFYLDPPELDQMVAVNGREFAPGSSGRYVLLNLKPGNYDLYAVGGAASGNCLCMGSVCFIAVAGKIL